MSVCSRGGGSPNISMCRGAEWRRCLNTHSLGNLFSLFRCFLVSVHLTWLFCSGVGGSRCRLSPPSPSALPGTSVTSVSHQNRKMLLLVVSETKCVSTAASLAQENDAEISFDCRSFVIPRCNADYDCDTVSLAEHGTLFIGTSWS